MGKYQENSRIGIIWTCTHYTRVGIWATNCSREQLKANPYGDTCPLAAVPAMNIADLMAL